MSRAEDMGEGRAGPDRQVVTHPPRPRVVLGETSDGFYLARIAELEEEVRALKAELARRDAVAARGAGEVVAEQPSLITADGSRGMQRGVSAGRSRQARGGETKG